MVDLTAEMAGLWAALGPAPAHRGRVLQFVAANAGEGTSTVAREFARLAAVRARKSVWLIDADMLAQGQMQAIADEPDRFGRLGKPVVASPDGASFYEVTPPVADKTGAPVAAARLTTARPCLGGRLWVSRFRADLLRPDQRVEPLPDARYWNAMRRHADTVIVDAPAAQRSDIAMVLAPFMDATVMVVEAGATPVGESTALRDEIESAGGHIAGVVMNRSTYRTPKILRRVLR